MTSFINKSHRLKGMGLILFCAGVLGWNMALSTRRQFYSGKLITVHPENLVLQVSCPGKIEPKVQETVRAVLDGPKKAVYVKEGDMVTKGQLLMEIGDDTIKTELTSKRNNLHNAVEEYHRQKKEVELSKRLYRHMAIPKRDLENAEQALERAGQGLQNARDDMAVSVKKALGVKVYSPLSGMILKIFIDGDSLITNGKELVKVAQMDQFIVQGKVDELDLSQIALGQEAVVTCQAFEGTAMKGVVNWIGAQAGDNAFSDIPVTLDIVDDKGLALKSNINAEGKIITGRIPQAIVIPAGAVRRNEARTYVLKASRVGWLTDQSVETKRVNADQVQVITGLTAGDTLLVPPEEK